jgi:bifunctional DNA-binding transcriptional regulator/antitoxin component of YhaV-PrlF toxin-antitoxin module
MSETERRSKCNWKYCPGWTIDWLGFVRPCGQCARFAVDDEDGAATAAREFIASFEVQLGEGRPNPCDSNCRGWAIIERDGSEMPGFDIERCDDCGLYVNDDDALVAAVTWIMEHLTHPEKYPKKRADRRTIRDKVNAAAHRIAAAHGWIVDKGHDFSEATDARSRPFWNAATAAYESFFGDTPDLDAEVCDAHRGDSTSFVAHDGSVELPAHVREVLGIASGQFVYFATDGAGGFRIVSAAQMAQALGDDGERGDGGQKAARLGAADG